MSLDRAKTNQNGGFLSFWGKIAFETFLFSKKKIENQFFVYLFLVNLGGGGGNKLEGVEMLKISVN